ncbi:pentapeptide repeat-containing protein [Nocardia sp. R16R-3T]
MRWGRLGERLHRAALLLAVLSAVVGGLVIAGLTWWFLWWTLGAKAETPNQLDLTKIALSVAAGVGGAVALVVAYRRQRDLERGRFAELFGAAARQLGDTDAAVRIAGVYAMAGVADEFSAPSRRQQCIDVLCGYLQLPYDPAEGSNHLVSRAESAEQAGTKVERVYQFRQNDRDVRRAIVRVIAQHLRPSADISWSAYNVTFRGAVLETVDFRDAVFSGRHTAFAGATFIGQSTFERARFDGHHVTFRGATFRDGPALFDHVKFDMDRTDVHEKAGNGTTFADITFEDSVSFEGAAFHGPRTNFSGARFLGPRTSFQDTEFRADLTSFEGAVLDGEHIAFDRAEFTSTRIAFTGAQFNATITAFDESRLGATSRLRNKGTRETDFSRAELHGSVRFPRTVLGGRTVDFSEVDFFGDISFLGIRFAAHEIHFDRPKAWVGIHFDWDDAPTRKPTSVKPNPWPPTATG